MKLSIKAWLKIKHSDSSNVQDQDTPTNNFPNRV